MIYFASSFESTAAVGTLPWYLCRFSYIIKLHNQIFNKLSFRITTINIRKCVSRHRNIYYDFFFKNHDNTSPSDRHDLIPI